MTVEEYCGRFDDLNPSYGELNDVSEGLCLQ